MSENELGKALLRGEEATIDLQALTQRVLKRDRRRMWFLGILCVCAWMMVVALPWATILPMMAKVAGHQAAMVRNAGAMTAEQQEQAKDVLKAVKVGTIATFIGSMASMFVAAICTVSLIVLSRRATLRQINARLGEISGQLKVMGGGK